jgi:sugar lactone lactonase YvrE
VNIAGATSTTLSLSNVQSADAGNYTAVATNVAGSATSSIATLTVQAAPPANTAPVITTQPGNLTVTAGGSATFTVAASGNPAPTYQWQKGGVNISGATSVTLSLTNVQSADAGNYTAVATNSAGSATSAIAALTVQAAPPANTAPAITTQPGNLTVTAGGSATFTVAATGSPTPAFQWQKAGVDIAGATGSSFTVAAVTTGDAGTYTVRVSNPAGSVTSANATLTVTASAPAGPAITTPLAAQSVTTGHSISFTAQSLSGTYQWQVSTDNGVSWANLANNGTYNGVGGPTLIITGATAQMNGMLYRYVVTDGSGSTASNAATLSVAGVFFPNPTGITLVGTAGLYLSDATTDTVQLVTAAGEVTLVAGATGMAGTLDGPGPGALFNQPGGLAADSSGVVYVADTANATIRRLGADGSVTTLAGSATLRGNNDGSASQATFSAPLGLALDRAGNLYVADSTNHTIRKITPLGTVSTLAGSAGLAGSANGTGPDARFNAPSGLAVDAAGNVFVADRTNNLIRRITPAGVVTILAGTAGISGTDDGTGGAALFNQPSGLALDSAGNLYVADTGNCTIRKITPAGLVSTLAGLPTVGGDQDGTGFGALFNQPRALAVDGAGNLYVADTGNAAIRFVTPGGTVTTVTLHAGATSPATGGGTGTGGSAGSAGTTGTTATGAIPAGGGGALGDWFVGSLGLLSLLRWWQHRARARTAG